MSHRRYHTLVVHLPSRYHLEQIVCQRPRHQCHQQVFSDTVCTDNTTCSWIVWRSPAICLHVNHHCQAATCLQCLVRVYVVVWPAANCSLHTSRSSTWFLSWPACIDELVSDMDDKLFNCITSYEHRVLHQLLPPKRPDCRYSLRPRRHKLRFTSKSRLDELNFIHRMLYKDMHWMLNFMLYSFPFLLLVL